MRHVGPRAATADRRVARATRGGDPTLKLYMKKKAAPARETALFSKEIAGLR
jgi:hypothetical protein